MKDEVIPKEEISIDLLDKDADIFRKLDIPWMPSDAQETTTGKVIDSDGENMQKAIK